MQICSLCNHSSPDQAAYCIHCHADLSNYSITSVARNDFINNPRVNYVRVVAYDDCCPACRQALGSFTKDEIPNLPIEGCSDPNGCRCFYQPFLNDL